MKSKNRYAAIIERIFKSRFKPGLTELEFEREEMVSIARQ
ncbi:MAG: endonuclease, partial [Verrucomicrobia bacterium]|nr:endonuclease [Verrucomicrobiota bacterium]